MLSNSPLQISRLLLLALGTRMNVVYQDRIPQDGALLIVSNHRSFMDAPLLMAAINRSIRFACHHYMGQVPVMREIVTRLGAFRWRLPIIDNRASSGRPLSYCKHSRLLEFFRKGFQSIVKPPSPGHSVEFQRGFAHLALQPLSGS